MFSNVFHFQATSGNKICNLTIESSVLIPLLASESAVLSVMEGALDMAADASVARGSGDASQFRVTHGFLL